MSEFQKKASAALRDQLTLMGQRKLPSNSDGFDEEFDSLRALDYNVRSNRDEFYTASLGSNMSKNRFRDVLPNEGTRVVLDPINHRGDGDYINANYIDGRRLFGVPFVYIATQAPMRNTVADFWRMVYENNTSYIVMLCAEIESGKSKSERYWPDSVGEVMALGPLNVVLVNENHRADTIFRTLAVRTLEGKERTVHHLQYTRWPDQSIPESSSGLMEIILALGRSPQSTQTPIVAHCSGGVGRTGVFITLHIALALFELEQRISMPHIVQYLKYCRSGMVQRKDQYLFCYYATLREMEKMIWAIEAGKQENITAKRMIPVPDNVSIGRRPSEYLPRHPAQSRPEIHKSALQPYTYGMGDNNVKVFNAAGADHGIRASADLGGDIPGERSRGMPGGSRSRGGIGDEADDELMQMRRRNQAQRRSAPYVGGTSGGRYDASKVMPGPMSMSSPASVPPLTAGVLPAASAGATGPAIGSGLAAQPVGSSYNDSASRPGDSYYSSVYDPQPRPHEAPRPSAHQPSPAMPSPIEARDYGSPGGAGRPPTAGALSASGYDAPPTGSTPASSTNFGADSAMSPTPAARAPEPASPPPQYTTPTAIAKPKVPVGPSVGSDDQVGSALAGNSSDFAAAARDFNSNMFGSAPQPEGRRAGDFGLL